MRSVVFALLVMAGTISPLLGQPCALTGTCADFLVSGAVFDPIANAYQTSYAEPLSFTILHPAPGNSFSWDFGDSTAAAQGETVQHAFMLPGSFVVTLTVQGISARGSSRATVDVAPGLYCDAGPPGADITLTAGVFQSTGGVVAASVGRPVSMEYRGFANEVHWDFDDGTSVTGRSVTHVFRSTGHAYVSQRVTGACGSSGESISIQVIGFAIEDARALVILGAGRAGTSSTEITLANPTGMEQFGTIATVPTPDQISGCPGACIYFPYHLLPNGTTTVHLAPGSGAPNFVGTYYVVPDAGGALPVVAASAVRVGSPIGATLPVYHLSTLLESFVPVPGSDSPPTILIGARKSASSHSNLLLTVLQPPGTVDLSGAVAHVEIIDGSGALLASEDFNLSFGESRVIPDVVGALGVPSLDLGQVRVTQMGGTNLVRPVLATTIESGAVTVSSGSPPGNSSPQGSSGSILLAGGGTVGDWDTEILLGNSGDSAGPIIVSATWQAVPDPPRHNACLLSLPGSATIAVLASSLACLPLEPTTIFIGRPEVSARIFDRAHPTRSADLALATPTQRLTNLVFPFSTRPSSLFLADVLSGFAADVQIEIWSAGGGLVLTFQRHIPAGSHITLTNLLDALNVSDVTSGQIRVTSSGGVTIAGALAAVGSDGRFTISAGINP